MTVNAQIPMDAEQLRDLLEQSLASKIYEVESNLRLMRRKSQARTSLEIQLASFKKALRAIAGDLPVKAARELPTSTPCEGRMRSIQNAVEGALHRRYCARQLQSEHDFLAGAGAALMAVHGNDLPRATDAVPPDWQELAMCGGSRLAKISDGAD